MKRISEIFDWQPRATPLFDNSLLSNSINTTCGGMGEDKERNDIHSKISRDAEDMLIRARRDPCPVTELYNLLGFSGYMGNKCLKELIREGLVFEVFYHPLAEDAKKNCYR